MNEADDFRGLFEFRPLQQGYGVTIGNALRRVLLSSLEGYAITSLKIQGAGKVDLLRRDMRTMERRHEEDVRRLWIRIAALTVIVGIATGSGRILDWIFDALEVLGI